MSFSVGTTMSNRIGITLTAYNLPGESSESDFERWEAYVRANIAESTGLDNIDIDRFGYSPSPPTDAIHGATQEQRGGIEEALEELWMMGCAEDFFVPATQQKEKS